MFRALLIFSLLTVTTAVTSGKTSRLNSNDRIRRVEAGLIPVDNKGQPTTPTTLTDRMKHYGIPSVSIAVINGGKVEWAHGYGVVDADSNHSVTPETLFQACSHRDRATTIKRWKVKQSVVNKNGKGDVVRSDKGLPCCDSESAVLARD